MKRIAFLPAIFIITTLVSCAGIQVDLPAVTTTATGTHLPGKIIWHDLVTEDPAAAQRFYAGLFGWQFEAVANSDYTLILHRGQPIGGMVDARKFDRQGNLSQWVVVLSVSDVDAAVETVKQAGGSVYAGPTDAGKRGRLALVQDPQGANIALLETRDGDPVDQEASIGTFMWDELWTSDAAASTAFYQSLVDYRQQSVSLADNTYNYLESQQQPRVAILANPVTGLAPTWVAFVRVANTEATSARVSELGGEVLLPSQHNPVGGELAVIKDPTGAGLIIQTWHETKQESNP